MIPIYLLNLIDGMGCLTACDTPLFLLLEMGDLYIYPIQYRYALDTIAFGLPQRTWCCNFTK